MKSLNWSLGTKSETDLGGCKWGRSGLFFGSVSLNVHQRPHGNLASLDGHKAAQRLRPHQQCLGMAFRVSWSTLGVYSSAQLPLSCIPA